MTSKNKGKTPARNLDKTNEMQQQVEAKANVSLPTNSNQGDVREKSADLQEFRQDNKKQFEDIKGEIAKTNLRMDEAEARIVVNEERLQSTEEALAEMLKMQEQLQSKLADQEGRSRRENVRIYGVPEGAESGPTSVISFMEKLLRENHDILDMKDLQIERAHQALAPQRPVGS